MRKIILIFFVLSLVSCKKDKKQKIEIVKTNNYVKKRVNDSIEISIPKKWKVYSDSTYLFVSLMNKSDEKSEVILLANPTEAINLRDYIIEDLSVAGELQQKEGLPYYIYKYYLENNNYCYILETFPKQKKGIYSFVR